MITNYPQIKFFTAEDENQLEIKLDDFIRKQADTVEILSQRIEKEAEYYVMYVEIYDPFYSKRILKKT